MGFWEKCVNCKKEFSKICYLTTVCEPQMHNSEYRSHSNPLFIKHNQLKISDLCDHNIGIFMYEYCNNLLPPSFDNMFKTNAKTMILIPEMH